MKIADYNQMMAYLTRPEPLPQPKPEELLEIQEQKRKDRLRKTMEDLDPVLMDESVDFIERENFATKGRPENLSTPRESLKRLAEIIQQADIDDELEYLMPTPELQLKNAKALNRKQIVRHKKGKMTQSLRQDFNRLRTDENSLKIVANLLGEDVEYVLDVIDEADNYSGEAKLKAMMTGSRIKEKDTRAKFEKIEKWITSNAKKFDDPAELKKAVNKRFGSNNILNQTAKKKGIPLFTQGFTNEILGLKGFSGDTSKLTNTLLDNIYKTTIYNFNPKVREQLTKEITNVLSGGPARVTQEARTKIKNNPLLKKFGFDQTINGPIAKLLFKEIGEDMYRDLQTFKQPRYGTDDLLKYLANEVNPKYKSMFTEAGKAIKAFQDNNRKAADKFLKKGTKIMYDHKIPVSLIKNGYADEIEYVKVQPTSEYFNVDIKNQQFDGPINKLLRKYEKATGPKKDILFNQILEKKDNFSKKYAGYLDDVSITRDDAGKIKFSTSDKTPILTKDTDIIKEFKKQESIFKKAGLEKLIASIGCPDAVKKADGGRIGFQDGKTCFLKGQKAINSGKIPEGAGKRNFIKFANKAMEIGKQSGKGLRTITKFGIIPEAIIIGADTLIRAGSGATFDEAFKKASAIYRTDDSYEKANELEVRRIDPANADTILNLRNFRKEQEKLSSLEQAKAADLALAGTEFDEFSIGETEEEIEKRYAPQLQEQENNLFNATISDAEERAGLAKEAEFEDKRGVLDKQSPIGKGLDVLAEVPGIKQAVDFFATEARGEPDVSAQTLANYFSDLEGDEAKDIRNIINQGKARGILDAIKKIESAQQVPEGEIREPNIFDEERNILFELAKTDPALAERLFGPSMTFAGDPIQQTDLQDEMNLDRGIYALGGRIGFADGPNDPSRRAFMKVMAGIMSIPIVGKFLKPAAKVIPVVQDGVKLGVDKLMLLVNKIRNLGTDVSPKLSTKERERVLTYEGKDGSEYELYEDLTTGDIRVEKSKIGSGEYGGKTFDTIEDKTTFEIKKGQPDEATKGKTPPDEYEESKAVFDQDGTVADFDEVDDSTIKAIEDEIN